MMGKLTTAFNGEKRKMRFLFLAGDLSHYIADAHMPLHTSDNHDGQLTDQREFILYGKVDYLIICKNYSSMLHLPRITRRCRQSNLGYDS
jgi:hypothetical protein